MLEISPSDRIGSAELVEKMNGIFIDQLVEDSEHKKTAAASAAAENETTAFPTRGNGNERLKCEMEEFCSQFSQFAELQKAATLQKLKDAVAYSENSRGPTRIDLVRDILKNID